MTTKNIARWVTIGALFTIPFLALYVSQGMFFPFITGKNFAFRILVEIAFSAWLALALFDKKYRPQFSWVLVSYALFTAWLFIADLYAVNAHKALWSNFERMDGWVMLIHVFAFFLVAGSVFSAENLWRKWWLTFVGASFLVCTNALLQFAGKASIHQGSTRLDATLGNAEYLAGYLLFSIAMTIWLALKTKGNAWLTYVLYALVALETFILFQTGTRGTLIAIVVAAGFGAVTWFLLAGKRGRKTALSILFVVFALVGSLFVFRTSTFVTESPNLQRLASTFSLKKELGTRITIWGMALEGAQARPVTGWGQEGFNYVFNQYYKPSLYGQEPWFDRGHNLFIDWLIAGGVPALILFILLIGFTFAAIARNSNFSLPERILLLSALVAYCVQGLVVFDNLFTYVPLAAILAMAHNGRMKPIKALEGLSETPDETATGVVSAAAVTLAIVLVWMVNIPTIRSSYDLINALTPSGDAITRLSYFKMAYADGGFASQEISEQLLQFASTAASDATLTNEQRTEIAKYAINQMAEEINRAPNDARLRMQYAVLLRSYGQYASSFEESARAAQLSPNKQTILFEQGIERLQSGDPKAATEFFNKAYDLDRNNTAAVSYSAAGLILQGDIAGGKKVLQEAYGTTTASQDILVYAYYQVRAWSDLIATLNQKAIEDNTAATAFQLAAAYSQAGMNSSAEAVIKKAIMDFPESKTQGEALIRQLHGGK